MRLPTQLQTILDKAFDGQAPSKEECVYLLKVPEDAIEASAIKTVADAVTRQRFHNTGILLGQIGIETAPCSGNCGFCVFGKDQHAAMRRVYLSGAPLAHHGQLTERRLAQVVAVITLAALTCPETQSIAVHEPNLLGLAAGANTVYAETGANPRDVELDTAGHRGADMAACRKMLYETGFTSLRRGDDAGINLDVEYLHQAP